MDQIIDKDENAKKEREIKIAVRESDNLVKNFKIHLAVFRSNTNAAITVVSESEFKEMEENPLSITKSEQMFRKDLDENEIVDRQTLIINEENYALAFNPIVWRVLNLSEKIAAVRVACALVNNKDVHEFVNYNSNGFVMAGKNYEGAFNIGSFYREDFDSLDALQDIFNFSNIIKEAYYFNYSKNKDYNLVVDFKNFEEMQYLSPLEPSKRLDEADDETKAFYFDQLYVRKTRDAILKSLNEIYEASKPICDLGKDLYDYIDGVTNDIIKTNLLVAEQLGLTREERDKKYLKIKCDIFNHQNTELEHVSFDQALNHFQNHFKKYEKNVLDCTTTKEIETL